MDSLQVQIRELRDKIDRLYEIIQCLDDRVRQLSEGKRSTFEKAPTLREARLKLLKILPCCLMTLTTR